MQFKICISSAVDCKHTTYNTLQHSICNTLQHTTGWRRCIGCVKAQVSFRKKDINYRTLLRKMTYKDKASYGGFNTLYLQSDYLKHTACNPTAHFKICTSSATHCNTLFATHYNKLPAIRLCSATDCKHTTYNTLQHSICNTLQHTTGWRRCIGCLKLQVNFRKRATNYRAILRKINHKDKASYGFLTPYTGNLTICNTLQHTTCNTLQHTTCNPTVHFKICTSSATHCKHTTCNTLQHSTCNTLQHTSCNLTM